MQLLRPEPLPTSGEAPGSPAAAPCVAAASGLAAWPRCRRPSGKGVVGWSRGAGIVLSWLFGCSFSAHVTSATVDSCACDAMHPAHPATHLPD